MGLTFARPEEEGNRVRDRTWKAGTLRMFPNSQVFASGAPDKTFPMASLTVMIPVYVKVMVYLTLLASYSDEADFTSRLSAT